MDTKFRDYVAQIEKNSPSTYQGKFLKYVDLKQKLHHCEDGKIVHGADFFELVKQELGHVNRVFEKQASTVLQKSKRLRSLRNFWCCLCVVGRSPEELGEKLLHDSHWCQKYAVVNVAILKKILCKHDTKLNSNKGREFLQGCWQSSNMEFGSILHSPLLEELKALDDNIKRMYNLDEAAVGLPLNWAAHQNHSYTHTGLLQSSRTKAAGGAHSFSSVSESFSTRAADSSCGKNTSNRGPGGNAEEGGMLEEVGTRNPSSWSRVDLAVLPVLSTSLMDSEPKCSVCLSSFYKPIGLACGHRFCQPCILAAVGLKHVLGPSKHILKLIPASAQCPECRQGDVFSKLEVLQELGKLSKHRDPESWKAREEEEHAWQKYLMNAVDKGNPDQLPILTTGL